MAEKNPSAHPMTVINPVLSPSPQTTNTPYIRRTYRADSVSIINMASVVEATSGALRVGRGICI